MNDTAIHLSHVTKEYVIHHEKPTLVERFLPKRIATHERYKALDDISIMIGKGERIGIIGPNGSGKTTMLKVIAGITAPTTGSVSTYGKIVSLIELSAGFHPDLSGLQNVFINGLLLGMSRREISHKLDRIIRFADIGQFIDTPLYTYSSGMKLRLGFAVAVHADPDILMLDEGMSVGDKLFQDRARLKIRELFRRNITILMVSHNLPVLRTHSRRILIVRNGRITKDGGTALLSQYESQETRKRR